MKTLFAIALAGLLTTTLAVAQDSLVNKATKPATTRSTVHSQVVAKKALGKKATKLAKQKHQKKGVRSVGQAKAPPKV